jgi:5-keto 4-deoxyuronate isomerase
MFDRNYYATHPDMMECVSNEEMRDRRLVPNRLRDGEVVLNHRHADRLAIGGVLVGVSDLGGAGVVFASDASNYVNGHVRAVDGGWLAH